MYLKREGYSKFTMFQFLTFFLWLFAIILRIIFITNTPDIVHTPVFNDSTDLGNFIPIQKAANDTYYNNVYNEILTKPYKGRKLISNSLL